jgi:hypothetical protein
MRMLQYSQWWKRVWVQRRWRVWVSMHIVVGGVDVLW